MKCQPPTLWSRAKTPLPFTAPQRPWIATTSRINESMKQSITTMKIPLPLKNHSPNKGQHLLRTSSTQKKSTKSFISTIRSHRSFLSSICSVSLIPKILSHQMICLPKTVSENMSKPSPYAKLETSLPGFNSGYPYNYSHPCLMDLHHRACIHYLT